MNLEKISDEVLLTTTQKLAAEERELTIKILHHLREVERRSLFAKLGYSSLFEYCTLELKYSAGAAQRRISSMRLLKTMPELEKKIEHGQVNLSTLSQAQSFFRQEKTESLEMKREVLSKLEGKSAREVEKELISQSSRPEKLIKEKVRVVSATHSEIKILVEEKILEEIEELKNLLAHSMPNASAKDIILHALSYTLKDLRPKAPKEQTVPASAVKIPPKESRYIPAEVKRQVWQRDKGQCTYEHNGRRCPSKHGLELDHIHPHALGGANTPENLRLRCRTHNQLEAIQTYGRQKMSQHVPRIR